MTCAVVQEREQTRLYDAVSRAAGSGQSVAVLDPTWPESFLGMATGQIRDAVAGGLVGDGDLVVFSSGSTGRPRGIVRSVESWQASFPSFSDVTGITSGDTVWLPGPLWSSLFLFGALHAGAVGAKMAFRDDDPSTATALHCVPSQLPALLQRAEAGQLPLVRRVVVAGDHCAPTLRLRCEAVGWLLVEYYGASELSLVGWRDRTGPFRAFPGVETGLRDGLLWVRSPYLARAYLPADAVDPEAPAPCLGLSDSSSTLPRFGHLLADPDADAGAVAAGGPAPCLGLSDLSGTVPRFADLLGDSQGWVTVSDLGRVVAGGFEVVGRGNLAVTIGGHTVVVEEVEGVLRGVAGVDEVGVLGVSHPRLGQALAAVVVGSATDASLRAAVAQMPTPSRPRRWLHADALPRTSAGKLRREALPELVEKLDSLAGKLDKP